MIFIFFFFFLLLFLFLFWSISLLIFVIWIKPAFYLIHVFFELTQDPWVTSKIMVLLKRPIKSFVSVLIILLYHYIIMEWAPCHQSKNNQIPTIKSESQPCQSHPTSQFFPLPTMVLVQGSICKSGFSDRICAFMYHFKQFLWNSQIKTFCLSEFLSSWKPQSFCLHFKLDKSLISYSKKYLTVHYFLAFGKHFGPKPPMRDLQHSPIPSNCWNFSLNLCGSLLER